MSEQSLWLGRVDQLAVKNAVVERLFAKTVAGEDQLFLPRVPQRDREHSVEMIDKILAVLLVKMRNDLGVGLRDELVTAFLEIARTSR